MGGRSAARGGGSVFRTPVGGGVEVGRHALTNKSGDFQTRMIIVDGEPVGKVIFGVKNGVGRIDDAIIEETGFRGRGIMPRVFPQIEKTMKTQGAKKIRLQAVNQAVGEKVWRPLGFKPLGDPSERMQVWEKDI